MFVNMLKFWSSDVLVLILTGPGTVFCDYASYVFMFLSIATSNMVATALAREVIFVFLNKFNDGVNQCDA